MVLVPISSVTGTIRMTAVILYYTIGHIAFYPWIVLGWLFGYKPVYWRGLYKVYATNSSVFRRRNRVHYEYTWKMPVLVVAPLAGLVLTAIFAIGLGRPQVETAFSVGPVYLPFALYGELLVLIALGNTLGPLVKKAYCAVCPEIKYVETVPEASRPAKPGTPTSARSY